jgi:hypothetical protein
VHSGHHCNELVACLLDVGWPYARLQSYIMTARRGGYKATKG